MPNIVKSENIISLVSQNTTATHNYLVDDFLMVMKRIYHYEIFKPMMDLVATLTLQGRLKFKLEPQTAFTIDEGNCRTFETKGGNKHFVINIKKINADVIIHEIGHMVENESGIKLDTSFNKAVFSDLRSHHIKNISLQTAIKDVMVMQVAGYPDNQKASELFTRYFQLLAMSKEVAGRTAEYGYTIVELYNAFPNTIDWIWDNLYKPMFARIDPSIALASNELIIPISEIKHKWAGEKIRTFHKERQNSQSKWSKSVKSIKDI